MKLCIDCVHSRRYYDAGNFWCHRSHLVNPVDGLEKPDGLCSFEREMKDCCGMEARHFAPKNVTEISAEAAALINKTTECACCE